MYYIFCTLPLGLVDEQQKVRTITALALAALAEAATPYGIESFDSVLKPLWKGIRQHRGKVRQLKAASVKCLNIICISVILFIYLVTFTVEFFVCYQKHFKFTHLCIFCTRIGKYKNDLSFVYCISQGLAAFLKAIGYLIPLMDAEYANYYTREVMLILKREFQSPDEEMKKIVLKVRERGKESSAIISSREF